MKNEMFELSHIDNIAIERLNRLGGKKLVSEMIRLFLENIPGKITEAFEAEKKGDLKTVERAAHSIKSSAGNLGAVRLEELALETEEHAASGNTEGLLLNIEGMMGAFETIRDYLIKERGKWHI